MDRRRALVAALALLAVLTLGVGAATLEDADSGGSGFGAGGGAGGGSGSGDEFDSGAPKPFDEPDTDHVPYLDVVLVVLGILFVIGALYGLIVAIQDYGVVRTVLIFVILIGISALMMVLLYAIAGGGEVFPGQGGLFGEEAPTIPGGGNPAQSSDPGPIASPTLALGLLFGLALLAALVAFSRSTSDEVHVPDPEPVEGERESQLAAVGEVAGAAADRIEHGAAVDNEVYRAWWEMTEQLDVQHPETTTAAEFATAAIDAGLEEAEVAELTELFEEVRYGAAPPSDDRERRAVTALRRLEGAYG